MNDNIFDTLAGALTAIVVGAALMSVISNRERKTAANQPSLAAAPLAPKAEAQQAPAPEAPKPEAAAPAPTKPDDAAGQPQKITVWDMTVWADYICTLDMGDGRARGGKYDSQ